MNVNEFYGIGRLARDPELKMHAKKDGSPLPRCFMVLAITRIGDRGKPREQQRTNYIGVVAWGEAAKRHAQYLTKGTEVAIKGELIWEAQKQDDGSYRQFIAVQANDVQYGRKSQKNVTEQKPTTASATPITAPVAITAQKPVTAEQEADFERFLAGATTEVDPYQVAGASPIA